MNVHTQQGGTHNQKGMPRRIFISHYFKLAITIKIANYNTK